MLSIEAQLNQALETIKFYERQITTLKEALCQRRLLEAQVELETRIASLPTDAKERLRTAFPNTDLGGLKQAINIERRGDQ
jgi:hypothetical protein